MNFERFHESLKILHLNTRAPKAYFIPFSSKQKNGERENSDCFYSLNGEYFFRYFKNFRAARCYLDETEYFSDVSEKLVIDINEKPLLLDGFDKINVPSNLQLSGYDIPQYTNIRYPFPFDPPYIPKENPCGLYIKKFDVSKEMLLKQNLLNFEGVDSAFYVWINGGFAGYSTVSHSTRDRKSVV